MVTRSVSRAGKAQSPSQAIRLALAGMASVSAMIITVGRSLNDDAAEQQATLTEIDRMLTETHDDLERAEWAIEPSERQAGETAPIEPPEREDFSGDLRGVMEHFRLAQRDLPPNEDLSTATDALERLCERFDRMVPEKPASAELPCFYTNADDLPIRGTPAPLPCPFCGASDQISVVIERRSDNAGVAYVYVHIQCDACGCEAAGASSTDEDVTEAIEAGVGSGPYCATLEAAKRWNERKGS